MRGTTMGACHEVFVLAEKRPGTSEWSRSTDWSKMPERPAKNDQLNGVTVTPKRHQLTSEVSGDVSWFPFGDA